MVCIRSSTFEPRIPVNRRSRISSFIPLVAVLIGGCGRETTLVGTFAEGADVERVWVLGHPEAAEVAGDSFRLEGLEGDTMDVRFDLGEGESGWMRIEQVPAGTELRLIGIRIGEGEAAFPAAVEGAEVTVNGLRLAPGERLPGSFDDRGRVLAVDEDAGAILIRPLGRGTPDLPIAVVPATELRTVDGDPAELSRIAFSDTVEVNARRDGSIMVAGEIVAPRGAARPAPPPAEREPSGRAISRSLEEILRRGPDDLEELRDRVRGNSENRGRGRGRDRRD